MKSVAIMFKTVECQKEAKNELALLVEETRKALLESIVEFSYPEQFRKIKRDAAIPKKLCQEIYEINHTIFDNLKGKGGVYAIFTWSTKGRPKSKNRWCMRYVGHAKTGQSRQRLRAHLVRKHPETGSQLGNVRAAIGRERVGIAFVGIEPVALRHFIESELIEKCAPDWNNHGILKKDKTNNTGRTCKCHKR